MDAWDRKLVRDGTDNPAIVSSQFIPDLRLDSVDNSLIHRARYTTQYVTGFEDDKYNKYVTPPTEEDQWMCSNQIVQRKDYASFAVVCILTIFIVGGTLIATNLWIDRLVRMLSPATALNQYRQASWELNELLELQAASAEDLQDKASK